MFGDLVEVVKRVTGFFPKSEGSEEQLKKNCDFVGMIIDGHYDKSMNQGVRDEAKAAFATWQADLKRMVDPLRKQLAKVIKGTDLSSFEFSFDRSQAGKKIIGGAFTHPYPSLHDMMDNALLSQAATILIVMGYKPEQAADFVIVPGQVFVNHEKIQGIARFDICERQKS